MTNKKTKTLFNEDWAAEFLATRFKKYWPEAKRLVSLKIEVIKIFLDYVRFTLRYRIFVKTKSEKILEKNVIIKAERPKNFSWPPRIGRVERDFLATRFLTNCGLGDVVPRPLEFYKPQRAYLYEEAEGKTLKDFVQTETWRVNLFFKKVPPAIRALKKIHAVKKKPSYANGNHKKIIKDSINQWLGIIKKYYPAGRSRAETIVGSLGKIEEKHKNLLFNRKKYSVTHGDFQSDNIVIGKRGEIVFIDFADSKYFNPLDDLASFLIQTEMHFKYVRPKNYKTLTRTLKKIVYASYFGKKISPTDRLQIDFFAAKDILRIITFISFTQKNWHTVHDHSKMMDSLLTFAEDKIKKLEKNIYETR